MKIHELLTEAIDLPSDGQGNYVVWDPQRRTEVIVPEKVVVKMMADRRIVGGAFNIGKPTDYPINRSVIYKPSKAIDPNAPKPVVSAPAKQGAIGSFVQGFKKTFNPNAIDDVRYSKFGRALSAVDQYAKKGMKPR
jgi:hypothetical protein